MITRRNFLVSAPAAVVCAPAIAWAANLSPSQRAPPYTKRDRFHGFAASLLLFWAGPVATELIDVGFSAQDAAHEMNRRGTVGAPWNAPRVLEVAAVWRERKTPQRVVSSEEGSAGHG